MASFVPFLSLSELKMPQFYKQCLAEALGTFIFVFTGVGTVQNIKAANVPGQQGAGPVTVAIGFGTGIATALFVVDGHLNPAITLAKLATRRITALRAVLYVLCQLSGSILASSVVYVGTPDGLRGSLGSTTPGPGFSTSETFVLEMFGTFVLALAVWATKSPSRAPFTVGVAVTGLHAVLASTTGAGINPARSFGPAVVTDTWDDHWIYWVAPIVGASVGAVAYEFSSYCNDNIVGNEGRVADVTLDTIVEN